MDDHDRSAALEITTVIAFAFSFALTAVRLYVRLRIIRQLGWDDFLIVLSVLTVIVFTGSTIKYCQEGFGRHASYLTPENMTQIVKYLHIAQLFNILSTMFARISICVFMLNLFGINKRWRLGLYIMIAFLVISTIPGIVIILAQCQPIQKLWYPRISGKCWDPRVEIEYAYYQGAISAICDYLLCVLPIICLWRIQIKTRIKVGICCLLGMGIFAGSISVARTALTQTLISPDYTYDAVDIAIFGAVETATCIWAACLPTLRPLFCNFSTKSFNGSMQRLKRTGYVKQMDKRQKTATTPQAGIPRTPLSEQALFSVYPERQIRKTTEIQMRIFDTSNEGTGTSRDNEFA